MKHEEKKDLFEEANMIEQKIRIDAETYQHNITIAETLREFLTETLEWSVSRQLEARMRIGEHCGIAGIQITSITCNRSEFERRKEAFEI